MTIENGTAIVLTYVLVSMGVIIAFLLAAFVIGWFIGRLRQRRRQQSGEAAVARWPAARITLRQGIRCMIPGNAPRCSRSACQAGAITTKAATAVAARNFTVKPPSAR
jgi:hypothetical protein